MGDVKQQIKDIIVCPCCYGKLGFSGSSFTCTKCEKIFPVHDGIPNFSDHDVEKTPDSQFQIDQMFESTFTSKIHNVGKNLINSEYMPRDHVAEFVKGIGPDNIIVELGSGNRRLRDDIINIDLFPFPNVDLASDVRKMPFVDSSIDFAVLDTVLEHVPEPHVVIKEIYRILKPGGLIICVVPWIFPYHGYPKNYFNISRDGLEFLFRDFSECKVEMNIGPSSALTNLISEYFAIAFLGKRKVVYSLFKGIVLLPIFLLKYFDRFWYPSDKATRIAARLCALAKK